MTIGFKMKYDMILDSSWKISLWWTCLSNWHLQRGVLGSPTSTASILGVQLIYLLYNFA